MNKKFYLGAILLATMTLSTGALTSCIDNDEPEGITELRGAKAELLRAKAAVELANAELIQQQVNLAAIQVKLQEALHATLVSREEAKTAEQWAKASQAEAEASQEWAVAEKLWAEANYAWSVADEKRAAADAAIAKIKAQLEVDLQNIKTWLLQAQNNYENVTAEIEAAKAVLTDVQATKLAALQTAVDTAWSTYKSAQKAVLTAMDELFKATNTEEDTIEGLQRAVVSAKAKLLAVNAAYDELKALAEDATPTAWETRMDSLKTYSDKTAPLEKAELDLKMEEIKQSAEYKAADKEDKAALKAYIAAQQNYNYLADGNEVDCFSEASVPTTEKWGYYSAGTHPTESAYTGAKKYDLDGANIAISNPTAFAKLQAAIDPTYLPSLKNDWKGMRFEVDGTYVKDNNGLLYSQMKNAFVSSATSGNPVIAKTVAAWEEALKNVKVTDEDIAADTCKANYEKAVEDAQKAHDAAVKTWEAMHKQYQTGVKAVEVSTDGIKKAMEAYNTAHAALVSKVEAYNAKFDEVANAAATKYLNDNYKWPAQKAVYVTKAAAIGLTIGTGVTINIPASAKTLADCDAYITSLNSVITAASSDWNAAKVIAKIKADADFINAYEDKYTVAQRESHATAAQTAGITAATSNADVAKAKTEYQKAEAALRTNADSKLAALKKAFEETDKGYNDKLTAAAQKATNALALDYGVLEGTKIVKNNALENVKYPVATNKVGEEAGVFGSTIVVDAVKQDAKGEKWEPVANHVMVATTGIDIDAALKAAEGKLVPTLAEAAWKKASKDAFGTDDANARHTELTTALINWSTMTDENGKALTNWTGSTLQKLVKAQDALAKHENLQGVNEEIAALKEKVAEAKAAIQKQIAGYTKAALEAYAAIDPAKKEHQAKHNAAYALIADVAAEIQAITNKTNEYNALATKLQAILNAYYNTVEFSYTDEAGTEQKLTFTGPKDFSKVKSWLKTQLAEYEKKNSSYVDPTTDHTRPESEGKIKDAEFEVELAEKKLERGSADDEFDTVALKKLALEQAQAELEVAKTRYEYALSQLKAYVAALAQ